MSKLSLGNIHLLPPDFVMCKSRDCEEFLQDLQAWSRVENVLCICAAASFPEQREKVKLYLSSDSETSA